MIRKAFLPAPTPTHPGYRSFALIEERPHILYPNPRGIVRFWFPSQLTPARPLSHADPMSPHAQLSGYPELFEPVSQRHEKSIHLAYSQLKPREATSAIWCSQSWADRYKEKGVSCVTEPVPRSMGKRGRLIRCHSHEGGSPGFFPSDEHIRHSYPDKTQFQVYSVNSAASPLLSE